MKHASSLLLAAAAAAGLAAAQSTTIVKILMPMVDSQAIVASVISAGPTATDFYVACPTDTPSESCGLPSGFSVLYGPSTMTYDLSYTTSDSDFPGTTVTLFVCPGPPSPAPETIMTMPC
jgi:hypothetical protein